MLRTSRDSRGSLGDIGLPNDDLGRERRKPKEYDVRKRSSGSGSRVDTSSGGGTKSTLFDGGAEAARRRNVSSAPVFAAAVVKSYEWRCVLACKPSLSPRRACSVMAWAPRIRSSLLIFGVGVMSLATAAESLDFGCVVIRRPDPVARTLS